MNEKHATLCSEDYGQDEDAALKLLTKHKALQADMSAYKSPFISYIIFSVII